jgi:hypothetical protein
MDLLRLRDGNHAPFCKFAEVLLGEIKMQICILIW